GRELESGDSLPACVSSSTSWREKAPRTAANPRAASSPTTTAHTTGKEDRGRVSGRRAASVSFAARGSSAAANAGGNGCAAGVEAIGGGSGGGQTGTTRADGVVNGSKARATSPAVW